MSFGSFVNGSLKITATEGRFTLYYEKQGIDAQSPTWRHESNWTKTDWYCPRCGAKKVVATEDIYEDNAGHQHLCLSCGFGFMHDGEYNELPKQAVEAILEWAKGSDIFIPRYHNTDDGRDYEWNAASQTWVAV